MVLRDVVGISIEHWCLYRRTTGENFIKKKAERKRRRGNLKEWETTRLTP
jgi:hypothetical protein